MCVENKDKIHIYFFKPLLESVAYMSCLQLLIIRKRYKCILCYMILLTPNELETALEEQLDVFP